MRDLWVGHIFWVRNVVIYTLAGNAAAEQVSEQQVVANAHSIAGAIQPFYGPAATDKLFTLLAGHYGAIKSYLQASIAHDTQKQAEATNALLQNAAQIAVFLSTANPYLPKATLQSLLDTHGAQHIAQIQQLQAGNYAAEAKTWSDMTSHIYVIADALAGAIAKQFPAKFQDGA